MSVNFYFVRHGQSEANLKNEFYNDEESGLTNLGRIQAAEVGYELNRLAVDFDIIFCSPFKRARETCKIALDKTNLVNVPVVIDERIAERRFDGLVGTTATKEHNSLLYHYDSNQAELDGVETLYALENRARGFIDSVVKKYPNSNVLVFSHGAFGLAFRAVIEGRPKSGNLFEFSLLRNGEIAKYET